MLPCDLNNLHINIIISHVDIIYLACRGQHYAAIVLRDKPSKSEVNGYIYINLV